MVLTQGLFRYKVRQRERVLLQCNQGVSVLCDEEHDERLIPALLLRLCATSAYAQANALSCSQSDMASAIATATAGDGIIAGGTWLSGQAVIFQNGTFI